MPGPGPMLYGNDQFWVYNICGGDLLDNLQSCLVANDAAIGGYIILLRARNVLWKSIIN